MTAGSTDTGRAYEAPETAIEVPGHLQQVLLRIAAAVEAGDLDEALRYADRAARLAPEAPDTLLLSGRLLLARGHAVTAVRLLEKASRLRPGMETAAWFSQALLSIGEIDNAIEAIIAALQRFAVVAGSPISAAAVQARTLAGREICGWIGIAPTLDLIGEVFDPNVTIVSVTDARNEVCVQHAIAPETGRPASFHIPLPVDTERRTFTALVEGGRLLGSGLLRSPDFEVDGRATVIDGRIAGWARLGWAPPLLSELLITDEERRVERIPTSDHPVNFDQKRFSFAPQELGFSGNRIAISVPLPDGRLAGLPDAPLLLGPPTPASPRRQPARRRGDRARRRRRAVAIVVPVYLGYEATQACLNSVLATSGQRAAVVVIDDCAPDPRLCAALQSLAAAKQITLLRNEENQGFPASANRRLVVYEDRDVILLNSDTVVHGDWLPRLQEAAYSAADIGTATPLSNNGSIASYPAGGDAECTETEAATLDELTAFLNAGATVELPTGVGFCIYLRRDCLDEVGLLDNDTFAGGYGEENDFCLRASRLGWRNVLAANVFVGHRGGSSFGARRGALMERNRRLLNLRHPHYEELVAEFLGADPLHPVRKRLDEARLLSLGLDHVLIVAPNLTGGVERFMQERCRLARSQGATPIILRPDQARPHGSAVRIDDPLFRDLHYRIPEDLGALLALLARLRISHIELHHFLGHDERTIDALIGLGLPYNLYVHDYSWICPRLTFLGGDGAYCGEPEISACEECVRTHGSGLDEPISVADLRSRSARWFAAAHRISVPSADTAARIGRYFTAASPRVEPCESGVVCGELAPITPAHCVRVAVIGAIGEQKRYRILLACARDAAQRALPLEFVVIGFTEDDQSLFDTGKGFVTGPYEEHEVYDLLRREGPRVAFFPSVTPETWCYALTPALRLGLPIVAFDLGALAERLRAAGAGKAVPMTSDPQQLNDLLLAAAETAPATAPPTKESKVDTRRRPTRPRVAAARRPPLGKPREEDHVSGTPGDAAPPPASAELSSSVRLMTVVEGLYLFVVRAAAPTANPATNDMLFPAVHVQPAPSAAQGAIEFLTGSRSNGNWLCQPGDILIARVAGPPATFVLTSVRAGGEPHLSIEVERLDNRSAAIGQIAQLDPITPSEIDADAVVDPQPGVPTEIVAHIHRHGDRTFAASPWAGFIGQKLWIEAFSVKPLERLRGDQIEYKGLAATGYETPWLSNGTACGSRGMSTPLLGFAVRARGSEAATQFEIEYSGTFLSGVTVGPKRNGEPCMSSMPNDPLEGVQLRIIERRAELKIAAE